MEKNKVGVGVRTMWMRAAILIKLVSENLTEKVQIITVHKLRRFQQ